MTGKLRPKHISVLREIARQGRFSTALSLLEALRTEPHPWWSFGWSIGRIWIVLQQLETLGLVSSERILGGKDRGYRDNFQWSLTEAGRAALMRPNP